MIRPVTKAVLPVAGLGTRFLPATKVLPKEMLPVVDKPLIQYAVDEALEAGIEDVILVTGRGKGVIEDHFDHAFELERILDRRGKARELAAMRDIPSPGRLFYTRQQRPLGLGHAVWCARPFVVGGPFAVLLPDDLIQARPGCLRQMLDAYAETGGNIVAVCEVPDAETERYGILDLADDGGGKGGGRIVRAKGLVEKPTPAAAPSRLSIVGRYILQPEVLDRLEFEKTGAGGEMQLTDAIAWTLDRVPLHGYRYHGARFDCGSKAGFVAANAAFALARDDLGPEVEKALRDLVG